MLKRFLAAAIAAASFLFTLPAFGARSPTGTITAQGSNCLDTTGGAVILEPARGSGSIGIAVSGTWTGTLTFQVSVDGAQFSNATGAAIPLGGGAPVNSTTANGQWTLNGTNVFQVCVYGSAAITGTANVLIDRSSPGPTPGATDGVGFNGVPLAPSYCDKSIAFTTQSTTSIVKQIAEVAGQHIYICGWILSASTATTGTSLVWYSGSGASCGSGSNAQIGGNVIGTTPTSAPATPNSVYGPSNPAFRVTLAAGDALCTKQGSTSNATTLNGTIFYTQRY